MKKRIIGTAIIATTLWLLFDGCSFPGREKEDTHVQNQTTIVFVDKSLSSHLEDSFVRQKYLHWFDKIVESHIRTPGDRIYISFIYENTGNRSNRTVFEYSPPLEDYSGMSSNEKRLATIQFKKRLENYREKFIQSIITKAFAPETNRMQTDIFGSIPHIFDIAEQRTGRRLQVYFLSDMVECSDFLCLSFGSGTGSIHSNETAQEQAKKDLEQIQTRFQLSSDCLSGINTLTVIFPSKEIDDRLEFSLAPAYWTTIFKGLGVQKINYY